jgi:hypothetical protein
MLLDTMAAIHIMTAKALNAGIHSKQGQSPQTCIPCLCVKLSAHLVVVQEGLHLAAEGAHFILIQCDAAWQLTSWAGQRIGI